MFAVCKMSLLFLFLLLFFFPAPPHGLQSSLHCVCVALDSVCHVVPMRFMCPCSPCALAMCFIHAIKGALYKLNCTAVLPPLFIRSTPPSLSSSSVHVQPLHPTPSHLPSLLSVPLLHLRLRPPLPIITPAPFHIPFLSSSHTSTSSSLHPPA